MRRLPVWVWVVAASAAILVLLIWGVTRTATTSSARRTNVDTYELRTRTHIQIPGGSYVETSTLDLSSETVTVPSE